MKKPTSREIIDFLFGEELDEAYKNLLSSYPEEDRKAFAKHFDNEGIKNELADIVKDEFSEEQLKDLALLMKLKTGKELLQTINRIVLAIYASVEFYGTLKIREFNEKANIPDFDKAN